MHAKPFQTNMMRRGNNTVRTVAVCVTVLLFLYGLYAYHDLHTQLNKSEEKAEKLRQQHDSLSAQIQGKSQHLPIYSQCLSG